MSLICFFTNVGPNLANDIKNPDENISIFDYLGDSIEHSLFMRPVDEEEVITTVKGYTKNKSSDFEDMSMDTVAKVVSVICKPLAHICNISLFNLEKLFLTRINSFLIANNILSSSKYGFRTNVSTSLAVMEFIEEITNATDNKKHATGVFIDLKKAFDTVDHGILITKLKHFRVRGVASDWGKSYLSSRKQFVNIDKVFEMSLRVKLESFFAFVLLSVWFLSQSLYRFVYLYPERDNLLLQISTNVNLCVFYGCV